MAEYEEAGYYEVQLNNKQLVFFFMAAVAISVVVFLCGVMVGRGVRDATLAAGGNSILSKPPVGESGRSMKTTVPPADVRRELDFPKRLEAEKVDAEMQSPASNPEQLVASVTKSKKTRKATGASAGAGSMSEASKEASAKPKKSRPTSTRPPRTASPDPGVIGGERGAFTIQVVALRTQEAAASLVKRLNEASYRAYLEPGGSAGLYRVRVGRFGSRVEAEQVAVQLREVEKFKPYITQ
jgi:cell division septation protein DedD